MSRNLCSRDAEQKQVNTARRGAPELPVKERKWVLNHAGNNAIFPVAIGGKRGAVGGDCD